MPPIGERMASVETALHDVQLDVSEVKTDVKKLVAWMNEERGARRQRQLSQKRIAAIAAALSGLVSALVGVALRVM